MTRGMILTAAGLLAAAATAWAQPPTPGQSRPQTPADEAGGAPAGAPKVCVVESKPTTRTVYGSACKEYCAPRCDSLIGLIRGWCGLPTECASGDCGGCDVRTRRVLVKKVVPGPPTPACTLKDVPAGPCLVPGGLVIPSVLPPAAPRR